MPKAIYVAFAEITATDFYSINRPNLIGGGGQSYVDVNASDINEKQWEKFFAGAAQKGHATGGVYWTFRVHNLLTGTVQNDVKIGRRRISSFSIRNQKLPEISSKGQRLHAWSPTKAGFPALPPNCTSAAGVPAALISGLRIFLIRDDLDQFWAGWTKGVPSHAADPRLQSIGSRSAGIIELGGAFELDTSNVNWPFVAAGAAQSSGSAHQDVENWDDNDELPAAGSSTTYQLQQVRKRNRAAVQKVKALYPNCQVSGDKYVFKKKDGTPYLEVHHLIPLGAGGADLPHNMIVVSAQIHRMLHHANVTGLDLTKIKDNELEITINGDNFTIRWHPKHAERVLSAASEST